MDFNLAKFCSGIMFFVFGSLAATSSLHAEKRALALSDHQLGQFLFVAERYEALSAEPAQTLLDDYGLSVHVLEAFAVRLQNTLDLGFYKSEFSCNATPFETPKLADSTAATRQRVASVFFKTVDTDFSV